MGAKVTLFGVVQFIIIVGVLALVFASQKKAGKAQAKKQAQRFQAAQAAKQKARGGTHVDHDHIPSTELSENRKLEQLKTLKEAGLLTQEEFNTAWQKIMGKKATPGR